MRFEKITPEMGKLIEQLHARCLMVNGGAKRVAWTLGVNESTLHDWFGSGRLKKPPSLDKIRHLIDVLEECEQADANKSITAETEAIEAYEKVLARGVRP